MFVSRVYTPDAYLELERVAIDRHEFLDGEIVEMAGGTPEHNEIALNVVSALRSGLRGLPFMVYGLDRSSVLRSMCWWISFGFM